MKKIVSLLLCVAMLCSLVVITAQADSTAPVATLADATGFAGATVNISMDMANNPGLTSFRFTITDDDGLGATFAATDNNKDAMDLEANDEDLVYFFVAAENQTNRSFGTLAIEIPEETPVGDYTYTVVTDECYSADKTKHTVADTTFTIHVVDESVITGVNVSIAAGLTIDVHVVTDDPDVYTITAVDEKGKEFDTIEDYVDGFAGDYIFQLKVAPWAMDREFTVDFTENFTIDEETDELDLAAIPETAKKIGILSYCNAVLAKGASDELKQLMADMLEYGRQAQVYNGAAAASYALPAGLSATVLDANFGATCQTKYPEVKTSHTTAAAKKFKFSTADIVLGDKFVVTFTMVNNGTTTAASKGRVVANGVAYSLESDMTYKYAFTPMEYAGVNFNLYGNTTISNSNWAWDMTYGPAHYAAYVSKNGGDAATLQLLNAFYNYGVSAKAYAGN